MRFCVLCCGVVLVLLGLSILMPASACAQADLEDAAKVAAQELSGENWIVEEENLGSGSRSLPGIRSFLGRLRARGGFPYHKLVLTDKGAELARTRGREFAARAAAKQIRVRIDGKAIECSSDNGGVGLGMRKTLRALLTRFNKPDARDAGSALAASAAIVKILTIKGTLEEAKVRPQGPGWEVELTWEQGSKWWEFHERAVWSLRFDGSGALVEIQKLQKEHTRRMLK